MKTGTFGVKGKIKKINVKPGLFLVVQKNIIISIPKIKRKEKIIADIKPGELSKEQAVEKISKKLRSLNFKFSNEEIMRVIPSGKISIK